MPAPTFSSLQTAVLEELVVNVSTDAPLSTGDNTELQRALNQAYRIVRESSGGTLLKAAHATLWSTAAASGVITLDGTLTSVAELKFLWVSDTSGSTGTSTGTNFQLNLVDLAELQWNRDNASATVLGTYARPKMYATVRASTTTAADVNKLTAEVWPAATATYKYFPGHYIPEITDISTTVTVADLNDVEGADVGFLASIILAPRLDAHHLVPGITAKLSEATRAAWERRQSAKVDARQDK